MSALNRLANLYETKDAMTEKAYDILTGNAPADLGEISKIGFTELIKKYQKYYKEHTSKLANVPDQSLIETLKGSSSEEKVKKLVKDITFVNILKELISNNIDPADIINILLDVEKGENPLNIYLDSRFKKIFKKHCKLSKDNIDPSTSDYIKYLANKVINELTDGKLTSPAEELFNALEVGDEEQELLEKALKNYETCAILIELYNNDLKPELLISELSVEIEIIEIENSQYTDTPVLPRKPKKIAFNLDATEFYNEKFGVSQTNENQYQTFQDTATQRENLTHLTHQQSTNFAHSTNYRPNRSTMPVRTPCSTMYYTSENIEESCRFCNLAHGQNNCRYSRPTMENHTNNTRLIYGQNSSLAKIRPFSIKDTLEMIPKFSGKAEELEAFVIGCGRARNMIPPENEYELTQLIQTRLLGEASRATLDQTFSNVNKLTEFMEFAFGHPKTSNELNGELSQLRQKEKETIIIFANKIKEVGRKIKKARLIEGRHTDDNEIERDLTRFFLKGMRFEIRNRIIPYASLEDNIKEAIRVERDTCIYNEVKVADKEIKVVNAGNKERCQLCNSNQHLASECEKVIVKQSSDKNKPIQCQICNKLYHSAADCRSRLKCNHCGKTGHEIDKCFSNPANKKPAVQSNNNTNPKPASTNTEAGVECYYCHAKGHRIAVCRKRIRFERISQENQGNSNGQPTTGASREAATAQQN